MRAVIVHDHVDLPVGRHDACTNRLRHLPTDRRGEAQITCHCPVVVSLGASQPDACAARQRRCRARSVSERCQFALLVLESP
jgi:hypothetical protein